MSESVNGSPGLDKTQKMASAIPRPAQGLAATVVPATGSSRANLTRTYARSAVFPPIDGEPAPDRPRYEDVSSLGQGGMGEVTLVQDRDINRKVAVKRLLADQNSREAVLRFAEEVRTIGQLEHPSIPPVHDVGTDEEGRHYFTMKYVEGETLESVITQLAAHDAEYERRYPLEQRVRIFQQILQAIAFAHANGVIHRDIKPSNVMVGPFGTVTVMDWGLAKRIHAADPTPATAPTEATARAVSAIATPGGDQRLLATQQGAILGTPAYMSPEQARGENETLDERSDVYSLGVVLLELITGKHYLEDKKTLTDLLEGILTYDADKQVTDAVMQGRNGIAFAATLTRAMAMNPADRFQSAKEFAAAVDSVSRGDMDVACPFTLNRRLMYGWVRWAETHPQYYLGLLVGAGVGLVGALGAGMVHLLR